MTDDRRSDEGGNDRPDHNREEGGYGSPNEGGPGGHGDWAEDQRDGEDEEA